MTTNLLAPNLDLRNPLIPEILIFLLSPQEAKLFNLGTGGGGYRKGCGRGVGITLRKKTALKREAAICQKRVGTVQIRRKSSGRSLRGAPAKDHLRTQRPGPGAKATYRTAAVTPPPRAAAPEARGSYESSSPGSASRSASAFRPRRGRRLPLPGSPGEKTGRKEKSGWRRHEPARSQSRGRR